MDTKQFCPGCGRPLATNAPRGICPECLMQGAFLTGTDTQAGDGSRFIPPTVAELAPHFPQFEVLAFIGQGGMGAVYQARQKQLDRIVALKILPPGIGRDAAFAARFAREAKALARLNHPGIVTIHDFGQADGLYYLVMEFVDGVTLRQLLHGSRISAREALAIVPQICDALQFAHDQGIVHRDIKPENILLDRRGRVKVADFGLAKIMDPQVGGAEASTGADPGAATAQGPTGVMGTPNYMAPEQRDHPGEVDHRADIYALGVVFYQMLTGELPAGKFEPPSKKVHIDVRLDEVVLRALEKQPALRYQQAGDVKTCVETIMGTPAGSQPAEAQPAGKTEQKSRFSRTAIAGIACLGLVVILVFLEILALHQVAVDSVQQRMAAARNAAAALHSLAGSAHPLSSLPPSLPNPGWQLVLNFLLPILTIGLLLASPILGWIAVTQIRHPAGRLHGLWLAALAGLLVPLLALDAAIGFIWFNVGDGFFGLLPNNNNAQFSYLVVVILTGLSSLIVDYLIIQKVWRAINLMQSSLGKAPVRPPKSKRLALIVAVAVLICGLGLFFFVRSPGGLSKPIPLADQPFELRKRPTAEVIAAGLSEPQSAWPWQELQSRAQAGRLSRDEAGQIMDGITAWMRRDYPNGYNQPLFWLGDLLTDLSTRQLVAETNALAFLDAYGGSPALDPLPRLEEHQRTLDLTCQLRSVWDHSNEGLFGYKLLGQVTSITIDGRPVLARYETPKDWDWYQYMGEVRLPELAPGRHVLTCEVESDWIKTTYLTALAKDAPATDWPPAGHRRHTIIKEDLLVYAKDAKIVKLSDDPVLDPVANNALSVSGTIIRPKGGHLTAVLSFNVKPKPTLPLSMDVTLKIGSQIVQGGNLWAEQSTNGSTATGGWDGLSFDIGPLDPEVKTAEIVLSPDPKAVELHSAIDRIWSRDIVFSHIPLTRLDLALAGPLETLTNSGRSLWAQNNQIRSAMPRLWWRI
jgi:serine/threonine protein kinase